ncbi:MAG: hypothetical protein IH600_15010 [Bacteroidetes bacterium]|nr:hypothetical protein [Bacteroidota bacterium]
MDQQEIFFKEWATADFRIRRMFKSRYNADTMRWERLISHPADRAGDYAFTSLYSWRTQDPKADPVIHYIIFDFDSADMVDAAQDDAINFIKYLETMHEVNPGCLGLFFSGHKGFHVQLPIGLIASGEALWGVSSSIIRDFALRIGEGFRTLDRSVFDARRMFRIQGGVNINSGLRKIPLTWQDLQSLDVSDIRSMAADPSPDIEREESAVSASLYEIMLTAAETHSEIARRQPTVSLQDIFAQAEPGERNTRATQLAGLLVKAMDDLPLIREMVRTWNRSNQHPLLDRELDIIINGVYERYHSRHPHRRSTHAVGF